MRIWKVIVDNKDITMWGAGGVFLMLVSANWIELIASILFPTLGWIILYFIKREITYRFPPKNRKAELEENNGASNSNK